MEKIKVYVVQHLLYDHEYIVGVYSSKEKAENARDKDLTENKNNILDYEIEEYFIDEE